jgi:hypothetical protein
MNPQQALSSDGNFAPLATDEWTWRIGSEGPILLKKSDNRPK